MPIKTSRFDAAEYLDSPEAIAAYLNDAITHGDRDELVTALGTVARARGMSGVARDAGLGRESLYKALGGGAKPEFATVSRVLGALGLQVSVAPVRRVRTRRQAAAARRKAHGR